MMSLHSREAANKSLERFASIPDRAVPLEVGEKVLARWKEHNYQGRLWPAEVVGIDLTGDSPTYSLVFTDDTSKILGHEDANCPLQYIWRTNGEQPAAMAKKVVNNKKRKRGLASNNQETTYLPFYGEIHSATLEHGDDPFANRLKFKIANGLLMNGKEKWLPDAEISLQDMFHSQEYAPTQHETNIFAQCLADFMCKLLNTSPSYEQQPVLLSGF